MGLGLSPLSSLAAGPDAGRVLLFSDLHFDPFQDPALFPALTQAGADEWASIFQGSSRTRVSGYGEESNYPLFRSLLDKAARTLPQPDSIIFPGDILCHQFNSKFQKISKSGSQAELRAFIDKTASFFSRQVSQSFPGAPAYFSLGNNDSYCGDYMIEPGGAFLRNSAQTFGTYLLGPSRDRGSFEQTYPHGGYYSLIPNQGASGLLISLNTIFFSYNYSDACGSGQSRDPGLVQLDWLEGELKKARADSRRIWLLLHVPPGVNVYSSISRYSRAGGGLSTTRMMWQDRYLDRFLEITQTYGDMFSAMFAGHTHMDDFRLLEGGRNFVHICPSVSPIFGNNPGFQTLSYNRSTLAVTDYQAFFMDVSRAGANKPVPDWQPEYTYSQAYGQPALDHQSLTRVHQAMTLPGPAQSKYMKFYNGSRTAQPAIDSSNIRAFWCGIGQSRSEAFLACYNTAPR